MHEAEAGRSVTGPEGGDVGRLIRAAFEQARRKGKPGWQAMTIAVLKNRLLAVTDGAFDERAYGANTMADFVRSVPDVVRVDFDREYPLVTLIDDAPEPTPRANAHSNARRLRPDLWRAILDYRSGHTYVWDADAGLAVRGEEGRSGLNLPTVSEAELDEWRSDFVDRAGERASEEVQEALEQWRNKRLPTTLLPPHLRPRWNETLTRNAVERLRAWFAEHNLKAPGDLMVTSAVETREVADVTALRRYVQSCIARMTPSELRQLQLPASAAARVAGVERPK